jgi:hypothetical protein
MKQVLAALFLLSFAFGAKTALAQNCDPCPATHCLSQTAGQGCGPIGTCNTNPPYCDAGGGGGGGGATSSVMFDFTVAQSVNSAFKLTLTPNPGGPFPCSAATGTILTTASWTGGDGNAPVLSLANPTDNLVISGNNVVVGPGGFPAGICNMNNNVTVTAIQP